LDKWKEEIKQIKYKEQRCWGDVINTLSINKIASKRTGVFNSKPERTNQSAVGEGDRKKNLIEYSFERAFFGCKNLLSTQVAVGTSENILTAFAGVGNFTHRASKLTL
jgi:hypothetical protein